MALKFALAAAGVAIAILLVSLSGEKADEQLEADLALLASMPSFAGATLIREYVRTEDGAVWRGREYATDLSLPEAATAVTEFYNQRLAAAGWQAGEQHAAISGYRRGTQRAALLRNGPEPAGGSGKRTTASHAVPATARFFYAIEVSSTAR